MHKHPHMHATHAQAHVIHRHIHAHALPVAMHCMVLTNSDASYSQQCYCIGNANMADNSRCEFYVWGSDSCFCFLHHTERTHSSQTSSMPLCPSDTLTVLLTTRNSNPQESNQAYPRPTNTRCEVIANTQWQWSPDARRVFGINWLDRNNGLECKSINEPAGESHFRIWPPLGLPSVQPQCI